MYARTDCIFLSVFNKKVNSMNQHAVKSLDPTLTCGGCWRFRGEQAKSLCLGSIFQAWPCIVVQDFGCMVIGNVLSGDSYHSCLSEAGTLVACGEGCLKFSGEHWGRLTLCRLEITSETGLIPGRQITVAVAEGPRWLLDVFHSQTEVNILTCTQEMRKQLNGYELQASHIRHFFVSPETQTEMFLPNKLIAI